MTQRIVIEIPAPAAAGAQGSDESLSTTLEVVEPRYPRAFEAVLSERWMITPEGMRTILSVVATGEGDSYRPQASLIDAFSIEPRAAPFVRNGAGVISVTGPIFPRGNMLTRNSGATSLKSVESEFWAFLDEPAVDRIVLMMGTPGGDATGIQAFAELVYEARQVKPIIAVAQDMAASAGLWIASAATEVVANPTAFLGSLGVVMTAWRSQSDPDRIQFVSSQSPLKREDPSSDTGRARTQALVDAVAQVFVETVARNRGLDVETVLSDFGRGGLLVGADAVRVGMADRLGTLEQVIAGSSGDRGNPQRRSSMTTKTDTPEITRELIAEKYPAIADAFRKEGREAASAEHQAALDAAKKTAHDEGFAAGAAAERDRIKAVQDQSIPGHEALIERLKFDGKTTGPEAAVQVLAAEKSARGNALDQIRREAVEPVAPSTDTPTTKQDTKDDPRPIEEQCKEKWDSDPQLRSEFGDSFDRFLAYSKANADGRVRVFRPGAAAR